MNSVETILRVTRPDGWSVGRAQNKSLHLAKLCVTLHSTVWARGMTPTSALVPRPPFIRAETVTVNNLYYKYLYNIGAMSQ